MSDAPESGAPFFNYADGSKPAVGDRIRCHHGEFVIESVIDTPEMKAHWGVEESGLMLANGEFGLLFLWGVDTEQEEFELIERAPRDEG